MAIEALEGLTDEQLFNDANADEAPADMVVAETTEAPTEQQGQARDEAGRFAGKPETQPDTPAAAAAAAIAAPAATDPPAKTPVDDNAAMVPSWRVREINEEKRQFAAENERIRAEMAELRQIRQQPPPKPVDAPKVEKPDPLLDPDGYARSVRDEIREEIRNERAEDSLQLAHRTYKAEFEEAYAAAQKQIDPVLKARMQQSRNPGGTLMEWHRENKTRAEVGNDLTAFRQREEERLLSDPAFLAKAIEKARGTAQSAVNGKPPATSLPPSLTRIASAAANTADDDDISNEGLWRHANAT